MSTQSICPSCGTEIKIESRSNPGTWLSCPECEAELKVICLRPPIVDWAYEGPEIAGTSPFSPQRPRRGQ